MIIEIDDRTSLCYLCVREDGWSTSTATIQELRKTLPAEREIIISVFPKVYIPAMSDKPYFDAVMNSGIQEGNKVLVIGCGSGSDVWLASTMAKAKIYAIDVNEQAILNTYASANLGGFEVKPVQGDIRDIKLPGDFSEFDFVLWNMPYLGVNELEPWNGDDGTTATAFMQLLPKLLSKTGKAIICNCHVTLPCTFSKSVYQVLPNTTRQLLKSISTRKT